MKIIQSFLVLSLLLPTLSAYAQKEVPPVIVTPNGDGKSETKDTGPGTGAGETAPGSSNGSGTMNDAPAGAGVVPPVRPGTGIGSGMTNAASMQAVILNQENQIGYDANRRCPLAIDPGETERLLPANMNASITQLATQLTAPGQTPGCINVGRQLENMGSPGDVQNVEYLNRLIGIAELSNQCTQSRDGIIDSVMGLALQFTGGPAGLAVLGGAALYRLRNIFGGRSNVTTTAIYTEAQRGAITDMLKAGMACSLNNTMNTTTCWEVKRDRAFETLFQLPQVDPASTVCSNPVAPVAPNPPETSPSFATNYRVLESMYSCFEENRNSSDEEKLQCASCNLTAGPGDFRERFRTLRSQLSSNSATIAAARQNQLPAIVVTARDYHNKKILEFHGLIENSAGGMGASEIDLQNLINHCYYGDVTRSISSVNVRQGFRIDEVERAERRNHQRAAEICANVDRCFQGTNMYNSSRFEGVRAEQLVCSKIFEMENNGIQNSIDEMVMNLRSRLSVNRGKYQIACNNGESSGGNGNGPATRQ